LSLGGGFRIYYAYQDPLIQLLAHSQNGQVTLSGNVSVEGSEVSLMNTLGKEVYRSKLRSNTFTPNQPGGIYIMNLQTKEGKTYSKKIIIQ
jgi:hypothetical protein